MPKTYEPVATQIIGAETSSITFSSIPQTYTDLVLIIVASPTTTVTGQMQINNDTGANYSMTGMRGNTSTVAAYRQSNVSNFWFDYAGDTTSGTITFSTVHFFDYTSTNKQKMNLVRSSNANDAVELLIQKWASTSAITSLKIYWSGGNIAVGSTFSLYGIKAA